MAQKEKALSGSDLSGREQHLLGGQVEHTRSHTMAPDLSVVDEIRNFTLQRRVRIAGRSLRAKVPIDPGSQRYYCELARNVARLEASNGGR